MAAVTLWTVVRRESETGGHAVWERREYKRCGGFRVTASPRASRKAYRESR